MVEYSDDHLKNMINIMYCRIYRDLKDRPALLYLLSVILKMSANSQRKDTVIYTLRHSYEDKE
jgi:hypothetical protein